MLAARFCDGVDPILDEIEINIKLKINQNSTEFDIDNNNVKSQSEHQIENQETRSSGWMFDKINSMTLYLFPNY